MPTVSRPAGLRAGFHADLTDGVVDQNRSGLLHAGEQWATPSFLIDAHTHPVWELYLQAHGTTRWQVGGGSVQLHPGHLMAVAPGVRHQMTRTTTSRHHFSYAAVDLEAVFIRHPRLRPEWAGLGPLVHKPDGTALMEPFSALVREVSHRLGHHPVGVALAVDRLVLEATRCLDGGSDDVSLLATHPAVARTRTLLDRECEQPWTAATLAARVGLTPTYLTQIFTREIGTAPHQYLIERRLHRVRQLLTDSDMSITAIAHATGFRSGQHLATTFRRATGQTPGQHRSAAVSGARAVASGGRTAAHSGLS